MSKKQISMIKEPSVKLILQQSIFPGRNPTIFFPYPEYCETRPRVLNNCVSFTQEQFKSRGYTLSFRVNDSTHVYNSMVNAMKNAGFSMTSTSNWNLLWTGVPGPNTLKGAGQY